MLYPWSSLRGATRSSQNTRQRVTDYSNGTSSCKALTKPPSSTVKRDPQCFSCAPDRMRDSFLGHKRQNQQNSAREQPALRITLTETYLQCPALSEAGMCDLQSRRAKWRKPNLALCSATDSGPMARALAS